MTDSTISGLTAATAIASGDLLEIVQSTTNKKAAAGLIRAPNNVTTTNPGASNDSAQGYAVGSTWFNSTLGGLWICKDASSGAAVWTGVGLTPIAEVVTASSQATIDFSSIPASFRSLHVDLTVQGAASQQLDVLGIRFNNDSAANYGGALIYALGSLGQTQYGTTQGAGQLVEIAAATGNPPSGVIVDIPHYSNTSWRKQALAHSMYRFNGVGGQDIGTVDWNSTAAINRVTFLCTAGNFANNSIATLYGRP